MRVEAHLNNAALAISDGNSVEGVIDDLLSERSAIGSLLRKGSVYRPSSRVTIPLSWVGGKDIRLKVPGGYTGMGALAGAGIKGYLAHRRAKKAGLKGLAYSKHVGKHILKGAATGAVTGYAQQLSDRTSRAQAAKVRHLTSKAYGFAHRTRGARGAVRQLKRIGWHSKLGDLGGYIGYARQIVGI